MSPTLYISTAKCYRCFLGYGSILQPFNRFYFFIFIVLTSSLDMGNFNLLFYLAVCSGAASLHLAENTQGGGGAVADMSICFGLRWRCSSGTSSG